MQCKNGSYQMQFSAIEKTNKQIVTVRLSLVTRISWDGHSSRASVDCNRRPQQLILQRKLDYEYRIVLKEVFFHRTTATSPCTIIRTSSK